MPPRERKAQKSLSGPIHPISTIPTFLPHSGILNVLNQKQHLWLVITPKGLHCYISPPPSTPATIEISNPNPEFVNTRNNFKITERTV